MDPKKDIDLAQKQNSDNQPASQGYMPIVEQDNATSLPMTGAHGSPSLETPGGGQTSGRKRKRWVLLAILVPFGIGLMFGMKYIWYILALMLIGLGGINITICKFCYMRIS